MTYGKGNCLATYNGETVTYDADGNMPHGPLDGKMVDFVYDARNRLIQAGDTTYLYDAENNRIGMIEAGVKTTYTINPHARLTEVLQSKKGDKVTQYIYGTGLIMQVTGGEYATYHYDFRGSTVAITDGKGKVTDTFTYSPYGKLLGRTGTTDTPFLYNGIYGVETDKNGLYCMRSRYYNPMIMRFINQDVVQGSLDNAITLNRYAYANGNPITHIDPFGTSSEDIPSQAKAGMKAEGITDFEAYREYQKGIACGTIVTMNSYIETKQRALEQQFREDLLINMQIYGNNGNTSNSIGVWLYCWFKYKCGTFGLISEVNKYKSMNAHGITTFTTQDLEIGQMHNRAASMALEMATCESIMGSCAALSKSNSYAYEAVQGANKPTQKKYELDIQFFAEKGTTNTSTTRVGRWMSQAEYEKMVKTGMVQESYSGTTHVANPASIEAFGIGQIYVEFDVPTSALIQTNEGWAKILGPNTIEARLAAKKGLPIPEVPPATNIQVVGKK